MGSTGGPSIFAQAKLDQGIEGYEKSEKVSQPRGILRKVEHYMTFGESDSEVFCAKFDPSDKYLACGYADGITRIYNLKSGKVGWTL
jgi:WD40 repeat protein